MNRSTRFGSVLCLLMALAILFTSGFAFSGTGRTYSSGKSPFADVRKGDIVTLGTYEQDDNTRNGPEDIEWIVLAVEGDQALVISKYCLTAREFHFTGRGGVNWEESDLRDWLNNDFYDEAFSDSDKEWIYLSDVPNGRLDNYGKHVYDTQDHVFVLSSAEAKDYLKNKRLAAAQPTEFALGEGIQHNKDNKCSWWWLRTNGSKNDRMVVVFSSGGISADNQTKHVTDTVGGVRPAIWISIDGKA